MTAPAVATGRQHMEQDLDEALRRWKAATSYGCGKAGLPYSPSLEQWAEENYWRVAAVVRPEMRV